MNYPCKSSCGNCNTKPTKQSIKHKTPSINQSHIVANRQWQVRKYAFMSWTHWIALFTPPLTSLTSLTFKFHPPWSPPLGIFGCSLTTIILASNAGHGACCAWDGTVCQPEALFGESPLSVKWPTPTRDAHTLEFTSGVVLAKEFPFFNDGDLRLKVLGTQFMEIPPHCCPTPWQGAHAGNGLHFCLKKHLRESYTRGFDIHSCHTSKGALSILYKYYKS